MSKIRQDHIFTSESVSEGHPDKVCDIISDSILDACLKSDSGSRVACETSVSTDWVVNFGEVRVKGIESLNFEEIVRQAVKNIGYDKEEYQFCFKTFTYDNRIHEQSQDIAQGVDRGKEEKQGAGDQGMMFGYATDETNNFLPAPISFSHNLLNYFASLRKSNQIPFLRPDSKAQVSVRYENGKPVFIHSVVLSHQTDDLPLDEIRPLLIDECRKALRYTDLISDDTAFYINPTGRFVIGGPHGDAGLTGRKIIVDTYGGVGSHGGGAFSGKDPSKVDRSAAYYARYAAKNIVAAGLAKKCEIQVSYAIGISHPISLNVDTYGTARVEVEKIEDILSNLDIFDFRPHRLIKELKLNDLSQEEWCYQDTSSYGHFGKEIFPWEKLDKVELIKKNI